MALLLASGGFLNDSDELGWMMRPINNLNIVGFTPLIPPETLKQELPLSDTALETVTQGRDAVHAILQGEDNRFLAIVGPCSIHDRAVALDYATRLKRLSDDLQDRLCVLMRAYFEKPRTTIGWKGLVYDPRLDGSHDLPGGLSKAREILLRIAEMGLPIATELLDPIVPQYIADLVSWASIGARTAESQTHREMASGLSMPIGFKNSTDGNLQVAIDAMISARGSHHFLGIDGQGCSCVIETRGNPASHLILRGGRGRPNYDPVSVIDAVEQMKKVSLPPRIIVDCSHANCGKRYELQAHVLRDVVQQRVEGNTALLGIMLESSLEAGSQPMPLPGQTLQYGVSITDPCLGWDATEQLLRQAYEKLGAASH